jgi:hypothetical protein
LLCRDEPERHKSIQGAYTASINYYRRSRLKDQNNHWVATQWLALEAIQRRGEAGKAWAQKLSPWWDAAMQTTREHYGANNPSDPNSKVWAIGSLLELHVLGAIYDADSDTTAKARKHEAITYAKELLGLIRSEDTFPLFSTIRQFKRYRLFWRCDAWDDLVEAILATLDHDSTSPPALPAAPLSTDLKKSTEKPI